MMILIHDEKKGKDKRRLYLDNNYIFVTAKQSSQELSKTEFQASIKPRVMEFSQLI